jgi:hypothetical protein
MLFCVWLHLKDNNMEDEYILPSIVMVKACCPNTNWTGNYLRARFEELFGQKLSVDDLNRFKKQVEELGDTIPSPSSTPKETATYFNSLNSEQQHLARELFSAAVTQKTLNLMSSISSLGD